MVSSIFALGLHMNTGNSAITPAWASSWPTRHSYAGIYIQTRVQCACLLRGASLTLVKSEKAARHEGRTFRQSLIDIYTMADM